MGAHEAPPDSAPRAERARMKRRPSPRPAEAALDAVVRHLAPATLLAEVQAAWSDAAGARVAAISEPVSERGGAVTVTCASAVWAQELHLLSHELRAALNARLGREAVAELRFRLR
jgi:predicted nucleic acid-binding Zn ribbon protein